MLSVPSAIIPDERIFAINPGHVRFPEIQFLPSEPFRFDPRLRKAVD